MDHEDSSKQNCHDEPCPDEDQKWLFAKILGITIESIPDLLKVISSFFIYMNAPRYYDPTQDKMSIYLNGLPSIDTVILGLYLLKSGKIFLKIGKSNRGMSLPTPQNKRNQSRDWILPSKGGIRRSKNVI
jgi:hypothetical protein